MMLFSLRNEQANQFIRRIFDTFPRREQRQVESVISGVVDAELTTAIRPFGYGGKVIHEAYFDLAKLRFFLKQEKIGAIISAFIIPLLVKQSQLDADFPAISLSNQLLVTNPDLITQYAKNLNYHKEVFSFLTRCNDLENQWRRHEVDG
jgi:hypothetical protein